MSIKVKNNLIFSLFLMTIMSLLFFVVNLLYGSNPSYKTQAEDIVYTGEYDLFDSSVTIKEEGNYRIYQTNLETVTSNTITIESDCTIYLEGVNICSYASPMKIGENNVKLIIANKELNSFKMINTFTAASSTSTILSTSYIGKAGINVPAGGVLTIESINSDGKIYAEGGKGYSQSDGSSHGGAGAGIGSDGGYKSSNDSQDCGSIIINSGNVEAVGGDCCTYWGSNGAGIGVGGAAFYGKSGSCHSIIINGGNVKATGGKRITGRAPSANAIGAGVDLESQSSVEYGNCYEIAINGGQVEANAYSIHIDDDLDDFVGYGIYGNEVYISNQANVTARTFNNANEVINNFSVVNRIYKVSFDCAMEGVVTPSSVLYNDFLQEYLPPIYSEKYKFLGWMYENKIIEDEITLTHDITLVAAWEKKKAYTIYFDCGENCDTKLAPLRNMYYIPEELPELEQDGYIFYGWDTGSRWHELEFDITLYAMWEPISTSNIYFYCGEVYTGIQPKPLKNIVDFPETLPKLSQDGHSFCGWFADKEFTIPYSIDMDVEEDDITLYAKWGDSHIHDFGEWEYERVRDTIYQRKRVCKICGYEEIEYIEMKQNLVNVLYDLEVEPTSDTLQEAKQSVVEEAGKYVHHCNGKASQMILETLSGKIDEISIGTEEENQLLSQRLTAVYADALCGIRFEKAKQTLLLKMAKEFNEANCSGNYLEDSLTELRNKYQEIEKGLQNQTDLSNVNMFELTWNDAFSKLKKLNLNCDNGSIFSSTGFNNSYSVSIKKMEESEEEKNYYQDKNVYGSYSIDVYNEDEKLDCLDNNFTIRLKLNNSKDNFWKIKASYVDENGVQYINAKIVDGYVVFTANELKEYTIVYEKPYAIVLFIVLSSALVGLIIVFTVTVIKKNKQEGNRE